MVSKDEAVPARIGMGAEILERSCVVIANAHNPSILNHDWLVRNKMLPGDRWELAEAPITTPPLSRICYQNNVELLLDSERLMIRQRQTGFGTGTAPGSAVHDIAMNYVRTLPHVPYVGVGNNFEALIECSAAKLKVVGEFGGSGCWISDLADVSVTLVHRFNECTRNVRVEGTIAQKAEDDISEEKEVLVVSGNYHRPTKVIEDTLEALENGAADLVDFRNLVESLGEHFDG